MLALVLFIINIENSNKIIVSFISTKLAPPRWVYHIIMKTSCPLTKVVWHTGGK